MGSRSDLQDVLEALTTNVYFQPPESVKMVYPCIVYSRTAGDTKFADDNPYLHDIQYQVMVIDKDPDSEIPGKVAMLPKSVFVRHFTASNLHHDVYHVYY